MFFDSINALLEGLLVSPADTRPLGLAKFGSLLDNPDAIYETLSKPASVMPAMSAQKDSGDRFSRSSETPAMKAFQSTNVPVQLKPLFEGDVFGRPLPSFNDPSRVLTPTIRQNYRQGQKPLVTPVFNNIPRYDYAFPTMKIS